MRSSVRRLEETYQGRIDFHILNVDHRSTNDLANRYQVHGIPMIVLLDAQGDVFKALLGYQTEEQLTTVIDDLLALSDH